MDKFNYITTRSFSASGNDNIATNLVVGSKDPHSGALGSEGNVGDLQRALNKLGAKPALGDDGVFGTKTKTALTQLKYSYPVTSTVFYKILGDANSGDSSASEASATLTPAQLKALWAKSKDRFGGLNKKSGLSDEENYNKWIARQKAVAGLKDFGKGIFQVGSDWLKQKQAGTTNDAGLPDDNAPVPTDSRIWGMPNYVVIGGGIVIAGLIVWGIIAGVKSGSKTVVVQQVPAPVSAPAVA